MNKIIIILILVLVCLSVGVSALTATGGTITTDGDYAIHTFTSDGIFEVTEGGNVEYLVVGGGGGGGGQCSGGGGAGGFLTGTGLTLTETTYNVTVGAGGAGGTGTYVSTGSYANAGENGGDSSFHTITAVGGGGTVGYNAALPSNDGGSGGGGSYTDSSPWGPGNGISGQGYAGGNADIVASGAGGGGAGGVGEDSSYRGTGSGWGGFGLSSNITGTLLWYAGGGGGGTNSGGSASQGGSGVGGTGGYNRQDNAAPGMDGRGAGGGGSANTVGSGKKGGSGIVIIRYLTSDPEEPIYTEFSSDAETTNFSAIDVTNVDDPILANTNVKIEWKASGLNLDGADIDSAVQFNSNFVRVDSVALAALNARANITMKGTSYDSVDVYYITKDGSQCGDCIKHSANPVKFEVSGFSNYTTGGNSTGVPEFSSMTLVIGLIAVLVGLVLIRRK